MYGLLYVRPKSLFSIFQTFFTESLVLADLSCLQCAGGNFKSTIYIELETALAAFHKTVENVRAFPAIPPLSLSLAVVLFPENVAS